MEEGVAMHVVVDVRRKLLVKPEMVLSFMLVARTHVSQ